MKKHNLRYKAWYLVKDLLGRTVKAQYVICGSKEIYEQFDVDKEGRLPVWAEVDGKGLCVAETAVPIMPPIDTEEELWNFYYSAEQEREFFNQSIKFEGPHVFITIIDGKLYTEACRYGEKPLSAHRDMEYVCTDRMSRMWAAGCY